jgi:hypothetical protein
MMKILTLLTLISLCGCRTRDNSSETSALQPATEPETALAEALTPIPGLEISESYHDAFSWYAESAIQDQQSLVEAIDENLECERQVKALLGLFFLEVENPRGLVSESVGVAAQKSRELFKRLNQKYALTYPTIVRDLGNGDFVLQTQTKTSPLTSIVDINLDAFETSLAAMNNEDIDESGTRMPLDSSCVDKRVHASRLFNLQVRFPGVISGSYSNLKGFGTRLKNARMIFDDLKTIKNK